MGTLKVDLKERSYPIIVGNNILKLSGKYIHRLNIGKDAYIITNSLIKAKFGKILNKSLKKYKINTKFKLVADTEKSKSIKVAFALLKDITKYEKNREPFIIALGGGVIGDLSGFIASIFKRGIPYIQIPTTLLSQIDSSIGGKTAIDLKQGKNLVGAFYQPRLVLSDISCLKTLPLRQMRSGLAEAIKYAIIKERLLFKFLEINYKGLLNFNKKKLEFLIYRCSKIKADIVHQDEKEKRQIRTILNFGHTLGHAIEAASGYKGYSHGEAISIGMLCALDISRRLGLIRKDLLKRIEKLIRKVGLPTKIKKVSLSKILEAHYRDKKFIAGKNRFVLIKALGRTTIREGISLNLIKKVLRERI